MFNNLFKALFIGLLFNQPVSATSEPLDAFPAAQPGFTRVVIELPDKSREQEGEFRLELIAGKMMLSDGVNQLRLGTSIIKQDLKGWGYSYYEVPDTSATLSTLMAAPEGAPQVEQFITTAPLMIRYNSRLPIVVYLPVAYELRYRIWEAPEQYQPATTPN